MPDETRNLLIHVRLEPGIRTQLDDYCQRERRTLTSAVNVLLDQALTAEKKEWPWNSRVTTFRSG